jgi:hypothetical protein
MNGERMDHLDDGALLRFLDGELPQKDALAAREHLEICPQCQAELKELRRTVDECLRYRDEVIGPQAPPRPWLDIRREFDRIDAAESVEQPARRLFGNGGLRWGLAAAATALVVLGVYDQLRETPSVQAAALLKKAVAAAEARPATVRRVRIKTRNRQITQIADRTGHTTAPPADVEALFAAAHYDSQDPLSAKAYGSWRDGLARRERDEISTAGAAYVIRTMPEDGAVAAASLMLRRTDLVPIEGRLEFRDSQWLELTDITETSTESVGPSVAGHVEVPMRTGEPSRPSAIAPGLPASISDELQVLAALHKIGADLGDPVEVERSGGKVLVSGVGVPPGREQQIRQALEGMRNVEVEFSEPTAAVPPETGQVARPAPERSGDLSHALEQQVGGRAELERLSSQILNWNDAAMARAYALRALAQRFPPAVEAGLSAKDRLVLRQLCLEHAGALAAQAGSIRQALTPMLAAMGAATPESAGRQHTQWQVSAEEVFQASRREDVLLSVLLGVAPEENAKGNVPTALLGAMRDVKSNLDECERLLSEGAGR